MSAEPTVDKRVSPHPSPNGDTFPTRGKAKAVGVDAWVSEKVCALLFPLITASRSFPTEGKPEAVE